jgi:hypothetical protein
MDLHITHHERVEGHPHRWRVFLHGHDDPVHVELSSEDRAQLQMSDEEIHEALPNAIVSYHTHNRDDQLGDHFSADRPMEIGHPHFLF